MATGTKNSPAAKGMRTVDTQWMDVVGGAYPVFDVMKGSGGKDQRFVYPNDQPSAYVGRRGRRRTPGQWTVNRDATLVATAGHLHPGGLWTDMYLTRNGVKKHIFRSRAKYWEPAGPVSWDVAMTATKPNWRVKVKQGDILSINATYGTRSNSWYESMGIMPVEITDKPAIIYLAAPAWSFHRDFEFYARMLSKEIELWRFELHENWRHEVKVIARVNYSESGR